MVYQLNSGETVKLNINDVKAAKKLVSKFIESVRQSSVLNERPTLYITGLIVMESMAGETLSTIDPDKLKKMLDSLNTIAENKDK